MPKKHPAERRIIRRRQQQAVEQQLEPLPQLISPSAPTELVMPQQQNTSPAEIAPIESHQGNAIESIKNYGGKAEREVHVRTQHHEHHTYESVTVNAPPTGQSQPLKTYSVSRYAGVIIVTAAVVVVTSVITGLAFAFATLVFQGN